MFPLIYVYICTYFVKAVVGSTLTAPPQSALVVGFENAYDLSLLANTLSDQGIDATLVIPAALEDEIYDTLIDVEIIKFDVRTDQSEYAEKRAEKTCEALITNENVAKRVQELQPTFTIFPALRHDGCLLPWTKHIGSIAVIWTGNRDDELYAFQIAGFALPVHSGGFWSRLVASRASRSLLSSARNDYTLPALKIVGKHLPNVDVDIANIYNDVRLILWGADTVLRSDYAFLTQLLVEIGCHHCRASHPLPGDLQKGLVEYRQGVIVSLLDDTYESLIHDLSQKLPQGRQGQAVVWKTKSKKKLNDVHPENLFLHNAVDRQDLIGYPRGRVLLSHCADSELLETAFHGTPVICFPRNPHESQNANRALELGFGRVPTNPRDVSSGSEIASIVNDIHESMDYREKARRVSLAIRDRLNPSSDRLIYWLRYVARNADSSERFLAAKSQAKTFAEDSQFFSGVFVGAIIGMITVLAGFFVRHVISASKVQISKGRYAR